MKSYFDIVRYIQTYGEPHNDRTGVGTTSVFGYQWRHSMKDGFPLLTTKQLPLRWIFEELRWFLSGSTDEKDLSRNGIDIWKEWATAEQCSKFGRYEGNLGPVYGSLWRQFPVGDSPGDTFEDIDGKIQSAPLGKPDTFDQIKNLVVELIQNPNSRRLIVSGWHPYYQSRVALPPCHTLYQCKVHNDNSLSLHLFARSIDCYLGLPFNIASYALLLLLLAKATGRQARDLVISFGDLHLYDNHKLQVEEQLSRDPKPLPIVEINDRLDGKGIDALLQCTWKDITLHGYSPHPKIAAPVAV